MPKSTPIMSRRLFQQSATLVACHTHPHGRNFKSSHQAAVSIARRHAAVVFVVSGYVPSMSRMMPSISGLRLVDGDAGVEAATTSKAR